MKRQKHIKVSYVVLNRIEKNKTKDKMRYNYLSKNLISDF